MGGTWGLRTLESLRCKLTGDELNRKGEELAACLQGVVSLELEKAGAQKRYADAIKEAKGVLEKLANDVTTGTELRLVEVYEVPRFKDKQVDIMRADTGELWRTRNMQDAEQQTALPYGDDGDETPGRSN